MPTPNPNFAHADPEATSSPVRAGDVLAGKYRVDRVLGQGGMGVVVAATHLQLDQLVALKFVLPEAAGSQEAMERFAREARACVKMKSEHVARVLDVGKLETGAPYMVMEYLEGYDLAQLVERYGPVPFVDTCDYILQACEAIAEAHSIGIVHRDLKPQNLFLTTSVDGRPFVKVLDFGISKFTASSKSGENMSLTRTAAVIGSPNYMSPEQLRSSRSVDARTDIWAMGVILYELLTGRVPFSATSVTELCAMVLQDTPRNVRELRPDVPAGLADAIMKCLEKDPDQRYQSVAALAYAIEAFTEGRAAGSAQRILAVARGSSPKASIPSSSHSSRVAISGGTSVSWGETQLADKDKKPSRVKVLVGAAIALVAVASIVFIGLVQVAGRLPHKPAHAATPATAESLPMARPSSATEGAPALSVPSPLSTDVPTTAVPSAPPATSAAPRGAPPPKPAAFVPKPPKPAGRPKTSDSDDLPDRN
jgi:serine/threonine-protein kinase